MEVKRGGRALPPRITLHKDEETYLTQLRPRAHALLDALPSQLTAHMLEAMNQMHQDTAGSQQAKAGAKSHALSTEATQVAELSEQLGQLIMPLRGFREHLVSCDRVDSQLGVEAYELSVDVCAAAGRAAASELLKPLQALAGGMYERAAAAAAATGSRPGSGRKHPEIHWQPQPWQGQTRTSAQPHCRADIATARQDSGLTGANTSPDVMSNTSGSGSSAAPGANSTDPAQHGPPAWAARAPEMQAGLLLFFAGSAAGGSAGSRAELVSLLSAFASGPHWQSPILQWALQVCVALTTGNFAAACKLRGCVPPSSAPAGSQLPSRLLSELLDAQLVQVTLHAVRTLAASYRSLPVQGAALLLGLQQPSPAAQQDPARDADQQASSREDELSRTHTRSRQQGWVASMAGVHSLLTDMMGSAAAVGCRGAGIALDGLRADGPAAVELRFRQ